MTDSLEFPILVIYSLGMFIFGLLVGIYAEKTMGKNANHDNHEKGISKIDVRFKTSKDKKK